MTIMKPSAVHVGGSVVRLEDGTTKEVNDFRVARRGVRIGDFMAFVRATKYKTTAERSGSLDTFYRQYAIEDLSPEERDATVVTMVSWYDARAYCECAGGRMITEVEWLAASVRDWDKPPRAKLPGIGMEHSLYIDDQNQMRIEGPEWTAAAEGADAAIVRGYPRYFLTVGWEAEQMNKKELPKSFYNEVIGFRVCFA